ncbi:hypothetical protein [Confluentibacter sediminis]|uniref:hypothetical protein n=1 Tax=Confluentibacter sediminis TaxID=2219045 RepID=UPI000DABE4E1|nr:hypothetical protein [Confluentibacter sediminis]
MIENLDIYRATFHNHSEIIEYDSESTKEIRFPNLQEYEDLLNQNKIEFTQKAGKYCIEKQSLPFSFFINEVEFKKEARHKHFQKNCVIHNFQKDSFLFYDKSNGLTYLNGTDITENYLFSNALLFFEAKDFFEKNAEYFQGKFEFTDFYSLASRKIIFSSLSQKRRITLTFPKTGIPELDFTTNYSDAYKEFIELFNENKHYPSFLKNSMISNLLQEHDDLFVGFFKRLDKINLDAKLNFNVYLHELSLDKIKTEYKEYKKKYYGSQNDILNKISSQVLALPISVAGSAFAFYKLKDSPPAIILICLALLAFVSYVSYIVSIYWSDIKTMKNLMDYDFSILEEQDFFKENKSELKHFEDINSDLKQRVNKLKISLKFINSLVWILNICLIIYGINIIGNFNSTQLLFILLFGLIIFAIVTQFFIFKDPKD